MTYKEFKTFNFNANTKVRHKDKMQWHQIIGVDFEQSEVQYGDSDSKHNQWANHYSDIEVSNDKSL